MHPTEAWQTEPLVEPVLQRPLGAIYEKHRAHHTPIIAEGIRSLEDVSPFLRNDLEVCHSLIDRGPASIECHADEELSIPIPVLSAREKPSVFKGILPIEAADRALRPSTIQLQPVTVMPHRLEVSAFQPFGPDAVTIRVEIENLYLCTAAVDEQKLVANGGLQRQHVLRARMRSCTPPGSISSMSHILTAAVRLHSLCQEYGKHFRRWESPPSMFWSNRSTTSINSFPGKG